MEAKSRLESKTYWIGFLLAIVGLILDGQESLTPFLGDSGGMVIAALGGVQMVLREMTKTPLKPIKGLKHDV